MPNFDGSTRRATLPWNWESEIVPRILRRDHHRCQWIREDTQHRCLRRADGGVDHRTPHSEGGTDDDSNLWALCAWHHGRKSGREGGLASGRARAARAEAAKPLHPGLMPAPVAAPTPRPEPPAPF